MSNDRSMDCSWCKELLLDYVSGDLTEKDNQKLKNHLNDCKNCRTLFGNRENDMFMGSDNSTVSFKKLRTRFIGKVVFIVAISLVFFFFLSFVFIPLLFSAVFNNRNEIASRVFADAVMFTIPSSQIKSFGSNQDFMNLKLDCKYSQNPFLSPKEINLTIPNFLGRTNTSGDGYSSEIFFYEEPIDPNRNNVEWDKLWVYPQIRSRYNEKNLIFKSPEP